MSEVYQPKRPTITAAEIGAILQTGAAVMLGEYRGHKIERIEYTDKQTGKGMAFLKCSLNVERLGDGTPVTVEMRLPRGLDKAENVSTGLSKGDRVLCRLASLAEQKGSTVASVGSEENSVCILAA